MAVSSASIASLTFALYARAHDALDIRPLAERTVETLPEGTLYWRIENFPDLAAAQAAAGPWSLATEAAGKAWLFTLSGDTNAGGKGTKVAAIGPIPRIAASKYL